MTPNILKGHQAGLPRNSLWYVAVPHQQRGAVCSRRPRKTHKTPSRQGTLVYTANPPFSLRGCRSLFFSTDRPPICSPASVVTSHTWPSPPSTEPTHVRFREDEWGRGTLRSTGQEPRVTETPRNSQQQAREPLPPSLVSSCEVEGTHKSWSLHSSDLKTKPSRDERPTSVLLKALLHFIPRLQPNYVHTVQQLQAEGNLKQQRDSQEARIT